MKEELNKEQCIKWLKKETESLTRLGLKVKIVDGEQYSEQIIARKMFEMDEYKDTNFLFIIERDRMLNREVYGLTMMFCSKQEMIAEIDF